MMFNFVLIMCVRPMDYSLWFKAGIEANTSDNIRQKWMDKVWRMNRSAQRLLIVTTNLDTFSLVNC